MSRRATAGRVESGDAVLLGERVSTQADSAVFPRGSEQCRESMRNRRGKPILRSAATTARCGKAMSET